LFASLFFCLFVFCLFVCLFVFIFIYLLKSKHKNGVQDCSYPYSTED
jgi:uncharacterized membrane protein